MIQMIAYLILITILTLNGKSGIQTNNINQIQTMITVEQKGNKNTYIKLGISPFSD